MSSGIDYPLEQTIHFLFTTRSFSTGAPATLSGTPALSIYEDDSITEITTGVSVSADHDGVTGLNLGTVVATAANGYESGKSYHLVITTGTVGGVSVVGEVVGNFTIERSAALRPTTAGRTLDVTAGGTAGIDWANVESPGTAVDLAGTDIQLCDTVTTNSDMRGTDSAALASVVGALTDAAAAGDPTTADTLMQYVKQLINILVGTTGVTTFPAEAAPANNVSLAEVIRAIHTDVTGLNGDAMRGTDNAALASVCTEPRLSELDAANLPTDVANVKTDTAAILLDTGTDGVLLASTATSEALVDDVWDEVLTAATHNVASSSGRRLRTASGGQIDSGTAQAGSSDTLTLATSASTTVGLYVGCAIVLDGGTGAGQSRYIIGYTAGRVATVARPWTTTPDATSTYVLYADNQIDFVQMGLAAAGGATSITLDANASSTDDIYNGSNIRIFGGTGKYQIRSITDYNGTTKVCTVDRAWQTNPDSTSYYAVLGDGKVTVGTNDDKTGYSISGTKTTLDALNDVSTAQVNTEVDTALTDIKLDHLIAVADADDPVDNSIVAKLAASGATADWSTYVNTTDSLQATRDHIGDGTNLTEAGGTGDQLTALAAQASVDTIDGIVDAILLDTGTDGVKLNATQPTGWAANLVASAGQVIKATVDTVTNTHTPTTTEFQADDITEATADHYNGRVVIFTSGVLAGQATDITDYAAVGGIGQFTVTAMTEAPANNDTFVIV